MDKALVEQRLVMYGVSPQDRPLIEMVARLVNAFDQCAPEALLDFWFLEEEARAPGMLARPTPCLA